MRLTTDKSMTCHQNLWKVALLPSHHSPPTQRMDVWMRRIKMKGKE
jgi:hypothetical protein